MLVVPLRCTRQGRTVARCRYAVKEPEIKFQLRFSMKEKSVSACGEAADHLSEERLSVHIHKRQVDPGYVQYGGSQVDVQHRSLEERSSMRQLEKMDRNKTVCYTLKQLVGFSGGLF